MFLPRPGARPPPSEVVSIRPLTWITVPLISVTLLSMVSILLLTFLTATLTASSWPERAMFSMICRIVLRVSYMLRLSGISSLSRASGRRCTRSRRARAGAAVEEPALRTLLRSTRRSSLGKRRGASGRIRRRCTRGMFRVLAAPRCVPRRRGCLRAAAAAPGYQRARAPGAHSRVGLTARLLSRHPGLQLE